MTPSQIPWEEDLEWSEDEPENSSYGPGNPDWEHDRDRELEDE